MAGEYDAPLSESRLADIQAREKKLGLPVMSYGPVADTKGPLAKANEDPLAARPLDVKGPGNTAPEEADGTSAGVSLSKGAPVTDTARRNIAALDVAKMQLRAPEYSPIPLPVVKRTDPIDVWGSAAMIMAGLGSLMTRTPLTTAMNAAAGVIKAYKEGDKEEAAAQYKTWEAATKNAIEIHKFQEEAYKAVLGDIQKRETLEAGLSNAETREKYYQVQALGHALKDPVMLQTLEQGGVPAAAKLQKMREEKRDDLNGTTQKLAEYNTFKTVWETEQASPEYQAMTPQEQAARRLEVMRETMPVTVAGMKGKLNSPQGASIDDKTADFMAEQYISGDKSVMTGLGYGAAGAANRAFIRQKIRDKAIEKGMSPEDVVQATADFAGKTSAARALGTRSANLDIILKVADTAMPLAIETSKELPRGEFVPLNKLIQKGEIMTSDPRYYKFAMSNLQLAEGWARAMNPTGIMRDADRNLALSLLGTATSQATYESQVNHLRRMMEVENGAVNELRQHGGTKPTAAQPAPAVGAPAQQQPGAAKPAPVQAAPMPAAKEELQAGQVYQTSRGPAKWNGTAFEAVH